MRVLVTGASGFIGGHVLLQLQQQDIDVHAVSRKLPTITGAVTWHSVDLLDHDAVRTLIQRVQPTHLLHFAWDVTPGTYWNSVENFRWVQASLHLVMTFQEQGGLRAVISGTCAEYDWEYGYHTENTTPLNPHTAYGVCKASLYRMVERYAKQTGLSFAWGRIFFTFGGQENSARFVPYVIRSLLEDTIAEVTSGEQIRDFMYVKDVAGAFVALLNSEVKGAVNIASGQPMRLKTIALQIAEMLGKGHHLHLGARADDNQFPFLVGDHQRLRDEVKWSPSYTIEQALDETIRWWQKEIAVE